MAKFKVKKVKSKGDPHLVPLVFLGIGVLFLILASVSAPIADSVYLFRLISKLGQLRNYVDYGLWGYCVPSTASFDGLKLALSDNEGCTGISLGYTIDKQSQDILRTSGLQNALSKRLMTSVVIFPVAAVGALLNLALALRVFFTQRRAKRYGTPFDPSVTTAPYALGVLTTLVTFVAFVINLIIVLAVSIKVRKARVSGGTLKLKWGNVIWLTGIALFTQLWNVFYLLWLRRTAKRQNQEKSTVEEPRSEEEANKWNNYNPTDV